jgi:REP element-mobilizing transposase RayT
VSEVPLAYFITFRCYGSWLPGDKRGTERRHDQPGQPFLPPHRGIAGWAKAKMRQPAFSLDLVQRECVTRAIHGVCSYRGWGLLAVNARSNHVHLVVSGPGTPELMMNTLKVWSTRALHFDGLLAPGVSPWSRHGSTRYLWKERDVESACTYVVEAQDHKE